MIAFSPRRFDPAPCAARPVIGVLCCNEVSERPIQAVATRFIEPLVTYAGVTVVLIPAVASACDALALASRLDGLLLTGSRSNVARTRYGAAPCDAGPLDEQRDAVALALAARMIEAGRSVFGICRGLQELNVLFGGTLTDTLPDGHHRATDAALSYEDLFELQHEVDLVAGGLLARTTDAARLDAQAAAEPIDPLAMHRIDREARATDDGLVEAFSARPCGGEVLAVQWHPEWNAAHSPASRAFFQLIGQALGNSPVMEQGRPT
jgi:gamma-glutamyl-gamma-aminobutyrate hydrolase PuuD